MGKYSKSYFENPYLDENTKKKLTADMVLEETRERWRAQEEHNSVDLSLDREELTEEKSSDSPSSERFSLSKSDLMGAPLPLSVIRALDYSPSYRPVGELEEKAAGVPMSTADRYDILAGDYEAPPEDISFLSDAEARLGRVSDGKRSGKLRRDTRRIETPIEERRRELMHLLPDRDSKKTERIVRDVHRKKERERLEEKAKKDELSIENAAPKKAPVRRVVAVPEDAAEAFRVRELNFSRYDRLPIQEGFELELPGDIELDSQSRDWSKIKGENPRWSEIQKYSSHTVPEDDEWRERFESGQDSDFRAHYIRDEDYDPTRRYTIKIASPRERLRSTEGLNFENEYIREMGIDPERVRELVEKDYRGRWVPPEFFYDDELVNEWFGRYKRGLNDGEDFIRWAAKQRRAAQNIQMGLPASMGDIVFEPERPGAKPAATRQLPSQPDPRTTRDEERRRLYNQAMRAGYEQGSAMAHSRHDAGPQKPTYRGMYPELFTQVPPGYSPYPPVYREQRTGALDKHHYPHERTGEYLPRTLPGKSAPQPQLAPETGAADEPLIVRAKPKSSRPLPRSVAAPQNDAPAPSSNEFVFGNLEDDFAE